MADKAGGKSKSARYYAANPKAKAKKASVRYEVPLDPFP